MNKTKGQCLSAFSLAALLALSACGGGGDGGGSTGGTGGSGGGNNGGSGGGGTPPVVPGTVTTPQYSASSIEASAFMQVNKYRQQCGFPALQENTTLDKAAAAHAQYNLSNAAIADTEATGAAGFTGVSYGDRATHFGFPQNISVGGVSGGYYTNATLTNDQYGQQLVDAWISGVYHIGVAVWPVTTIGVGQASAMFNGFPQISGSLSFANLQPMTGNLPLTFPCQGVTGVPYSSLGETPAPPNTSGAWGTPIAVSGNPTDKVALQSGSMIDNSGNQVPLQLLNSSTDPNKLLPAYSAVAYPVSSLRPNTTYNVSINGTINGTAFSRNFSFTTGNSVG